MPANWIAFARRDLHAAEVLLRENICEESCFHSQQAAEKALKGFLLHYGQAPPRSHALPDLLQRSCVLDSSLSVFQVDCATLNQYYVPTRYPDVVAFALTPGPNQAETQEALAFAPAVLNAVELRIFLAASPPSAAP